MQRWERTQKGFRFGNHFPLVCIGFALWYIEVCYDILDGHIQATYPCLFVFTFVMFFLWNMIFLSRGVLSQAHRPKWRFWKNGNTIKMYLLKNTPRERNVIFYRNKWKITNVKTNKNGCDTCVCPCKKSEQTSIYHNTKQRTMVPKTEAFLSPSLSLDLLSFVNLAQLGKRKSKIPR